MREKMKWPKHILLLVAGIAFCCSSPIMLYGMVDSTIVPGYVINGLKEYETNGYEAAVKVWMADSPYQNAATLASSIIFFKNIEMLAGKYLSYDILMTKETQSSNVVYVRMNFERLPGYILFTSIKRGQGWVLGNIKLDRFQRFGML
jgi:hypothetical protein